MSSPSLADPSMPAGEASGGGEWGSQNPLMSRLVAFSGLETPRWWLARYGTAVVALAVATLVRIALDSVLQHRAPYGVYLIATMFVVWRAGLGPAVLTLGIGAALARYLFEIPHGSLSLATEASQTSLFMFLSIGLVIVLLGESLRVAALDNARLYQLARRADARKDEFLATLAHELRNPLAPIRNALYVLDTIDSHQPRVAGLHQMISRQTDHLTRLVNDLLDVSRITRGKIELKMERVRLRAVVEAALEVVRPLVDEKRQNLQVSLPQIDVLLHGDFVRLTQVLTNLLNNAAKYTDKEGRLWLTAEVEAGELVLRVRDTGIGIAPENCSRIFELFEQAPHAIEHSQGGLGVGLTLVRSLVQIHGGTVSAKSQGLGLGSEFTVRLPAAVEAPTPRPSAANAQLAAQQPSISAQAEAAKGLKILLVEDTPVVAASMAEVLKLWNHTVEICPDGFAALETVRTFKPDVILADLGMPRMNGYDLARELRHLPGMENVALVAISGYGQAADRQRSQEAGFDRHLVKPVDPAELQQALAALTRP